LHLRSERRREGQKDGRLPPLTGNGVTVTSKKEIEETIAETTYKIVEGD